MTVALSAVALTGTKGQGEAWCGEGLVPHLIEIGLSCGSFGCDWG